MQDLLKYHPQNAFSVEICLKSNNCQFDNNNYVQQHGTAMGPKNACFYSDLAMGVIDHKAKFEGTIWTQGVEKLLNLPTILIHYIIPSNLNWPNVLDQKLRKKLFQAH